MPTQDTVQLPEVDISCTVETIGEAAVYDETRPFRGAGDGFNIETIVKLLKTEREVPRTIDDLSEDQREQFRQLKGKLREDMQEHLSVYITRQNKASLDTKIKIGRVMKFAKDTLVRSREFSKFCDAVHLPRNRAYECIALYDLFASFCPDPGQITGRIQMEAAKVLAQSGTLLRIQQQLLQRAEDGEFITLEKVKEELSDSKEDTPKLTNSNREPPTSTEQPIEDVYDRDGVEIRTVLRNAPDLEELQLHFNTALYELTQKLPEVAPEELEDLSLSEYPNISSLSD